MTVKILGAVEHYTRILTGSYSLDTALAGGPRGKLEMGFPRRTITELLGRPMSGKTTIAIWLAGRIAEKGKIAGAFLEEFDEEFLRVILEEAEYDGEVQIVNGEKDEDIIDGLDTLAQDNKYSVGILDSIGAIVPIAESQGKAGDANMGRRAFLVAKLMRRTRSRIRMRANNPPYSMICCNHIHPNLGTYGNSPSGGVTQQFMSANMIKLSVYRDDEHFFDDGSHVINGYCEKVKFGPSYGKFQLFNLSGYGPHLGLGAVIDCLALGLAEKAKGKKASVTLGGKSYGTFTTMIKDAKAGHTTRFDPFIKKLSKVDRTDLPKKKRGRRKK